MNVRIAALTTVALIAFASNSILCRLALAGELIDPGAFAMVRLLSGALMLVFLTTIRDHGRPALRFRFSMAAALVAYAAPFSFAYVRIHTGTGALILFGMVQITMISSHLLRGQRLYRNEITGLLLALTGLIVLTFPGASATDPGGALLMAVAGVAWGCYSLLGQGSADPTGSTAGNFLLAFLLCIPVAVVAGEWKSTGGGVIYAIASGALASGIGYAIWYAVLPRLTAARAGIVQLLVPVIAALGGIVLLDEAVSLRLLLAGAMILAGVSRAAFLTGGQAPGRTTGV